MFRKILLTALLSLVVFAGYPKEGSICKKNSDCNDVFEVCSELTTKCVHKPLFKIDKQEIGGYIVVIFAIFWAHIGGLSGGGILVPVILIMFRFPMKQAVIQSNASIAVCGVLRYFYNF